MTTHRCELAEALLYSPVRAALSVSDAGALVRVLSMPAHEAIDPDRFTAPDRERWPGARCWAAVPAVVAARAWPSCRRHAEGLDRAVVRVLDEVTRIQLHETRSGLAVFLRETGHYAGRWARSRGCPSQAPPTDVVVDLSRVWTEPGVRGLLLGPLDAWPVVRT